MDYGPTAQKVAEAGYALAKTMTAEVILMHVITDTMNYSSTAYSPVMGFVGYMDIDYLAQDLQDSLKNTSQEFLESSKRYLGDTSIGIEVKEGDAAASILEAAKDLQVDLIVMGSHSQRWLEAIIMGSVTEKVLHHSNVPVLIIPTKK